jgi:O-antigen/teichoic acid export membrane protein
VRSNYMQLKEKIRSILSLSSNRKKVIKNVYWAILGKMVNILSGLFVGILVARYLGPNQFGLMNYIISYVTLFNILATFGFDNIEIREIAKNEHPVEKVLGTAFSLRLLLAVGTLIVVAITAFVFESDSFTIWMIIVYSLSLIFGTLNVIRNYFIAIVLNEYVVKSEIARTLFSGVIKVCLLFFAAPLEWFIIATTFDFLVIAAGYVMSYKKKNGTLRLWSFDKTIAVYHIKESFPLLFSGAAILIYQKIDQLMIRNMIDNKSVGLYSVGAKLSEFILFIPMIISQTLTPLLVQARLKNLIDYKKKRQQFFDVIIWSTFLFSLTLSLTARPLILFLYGSSYEAAIPVLQIMAWKAVFSAMFSSSGQVILIERQQKYAVIRNLIGCAFSITLNFLLIPILGIIGSAIISIITLCLTGYLSHLVIKPYRYLFALQSNSIIYGLFRLKHVVLRTNKGLNDAK